MKKKIWVQHKSGQGEKWEVIGASGFTPQSEQSWCVERGGFCFNLPKSEYIECELPEEWEDVTNQCDVFTKGGGEIICIGHAAGAYGDVLAHPELYRLRKVDLLRCEGDPFAMSSYKTVQAFIVERKK
jgi:hypothetical protein